MAVRRGLAPGSFARTPFYYCFYRLIFFTFGKSRARLRRVSSYCSWGAYLLYIVLSVVVAVR